jgi:hypothetical protein
MALEFDFEGTVKTILKTTLDAAGKAGKEAQGVAQTFFEKRKQRLKLLAELKIDGELSEKRFIGRMADEKLILEAELNAISVLSKAKAQKLANGAIDILQKSVLDFIT